MLVALCPKNKFRTKKVLSQKQIKLPHRTELKRGRTGGSLIPAPRALNHRPPYPLSPLPVFFPNFSPRSLPRPLDHRSPPLQSPLPSPLPRTPATPVLPPQKVGPVEQIYM